MPFADLKVLRPALLAAALVVAGSGVALSQEQLNLHWSGGNVGKNLAKVFVEPYPDTKTTIANSFDSARFTLLQANRAKPTVDVGTFIEVMFPLIERSGLLAKLDPKTVPNLNEVYPELRRKSGLGVPYMFGSWGIVYNADVVKTPIESWADLLRADLKGKVSSPAATYLSSVYVLDAMARLGGGGLKNPQPGMERMRQIRLSGPGFWQNDSQAIGWLKTGEIVATPFYSGNMISLQDSKDMPNLKFVVPKEGAYLVASNVVKIANAPHDVAADAFINKMLSKEAQERWAEIGGSRPSNRNAKVPAEVMATVPDPSKLLQVDSEYYAANRQKIIDSWNETVNR